MFIYRLIMSVFPMQPGKAMHPQESYRPRQVFRNGFLFMYVWAFSKRPQILKRINFSRRIMVMTGRACLVRALKCRNESYFVLFVLQVNPIPLRFFLGTFLLSYFLSSLRSLLAFLLQPSFLLFSSNFLSFLIFFGLFLSNFILCLNLFHQEVVGKILDVIPLLQRVSLIFVTNNSIDVRLQIYLLHFIGQSNDYTPSSQLIVTLLTSLPFIIQNNKVTSNTSEGVNLRVRLKCCKIGWSNHQFAIIGRVQEIELTGNLDAKQQRRTITHRFAEFWMHDQQIILTNFGNDKSMGCFCVACVIPLIVADQLLTCLVCYWEVSLNIGETSSGILLAPEEDIESTLNSLYPDSFFSPFLSHQILLQSHQRSPMCCMLPNLYKRAPIMRSKTASALRTLRILLHKLNDFSLLNPRILINLPHEVNLNPYAFGMRFSPHKFRIPQLRLIQSPNFLQHGSKQFRTFSFAIDPGRSFIAMAVNAVLLLLVGGKNCFVFKRRQCAGWTDVLLGGSEFNAAERTQNTYFLLGKHINRLWSSLQPTEIMMEETQQFNDASLKTLLQKNECYNIVAVLFNAYDDAISSRPRESMFLCED